MTMVDFIPVEAKAPPKRKATPFWRLLFGDVLATCLTLLVLAAIIAMLPALNWATFGAVWQAGSADACREGGACWSYIQDKARLILFGIYPPEQHWRPILVMGMVVAMALLSLFPRLWGGRLILIWGAVLIAMMALMQGGFLGLEYVPTSKWGGLPVTLLLAVVSLGLGFPFAVLLALGRRASLPIPRLISVGLIELVRGLPLVGVLFVASILLPLLLPQGWTIDKLGRTLAALTLFAAVYLAEVIRGGLQGVDKGQSEAAQALGISYWRTVWHIILPQAIQKVIPPLTNTAIIMVKNTSLVMIVGVFDMLGAGRAAATDPAWPGPYTETYLFVAAIYFLICFSISIYSRWLEETVKTRSHS